MLRGTSLGAVIIGAVLIGSTVACWDLGTAPLAHWDEGYYAKIALDMRHAGDWLVYTLDGEIDPTNSKPPLLFYSLRGSFELLGPTELAVRASSAVSFVLLLVATVAFVHRVLSPSAAWLTLALMVASRPFVFQHFARHGAADAPLALFLSVTMYALWFEPTIASVALTVAAFALALLAKGVAALQILPGVALWLLAWRDRRFAAAVPVVALIAAVPLVLWLVLREAAAPGFVMDMLRIDVFGRATEAVGAPETSPLFYGERLVHDLARIAAAVLGLAVCCRGTLPLGAQLRRPGERDRLLSFLLLWWLVPIAGFSMAGTKHAWYALPSYVPAYVLAGWLLAAGATALRERLPSTWRSVGVPLVLVGLLSFVGGRTLTALVRRYPAEAASRRAALDLFLASITDPRGPCAEVSVFRADELPATRFYLTRANVRYRTVDAGSLPDIRDGRRGCIVASRARRGELGQVRADLAMVAEYPELDMVVVHAR